MNSTLRDKSYTALFCDEIAEIIGNIGIMQAVDCNGMSYTIPRELVITENTYHWRYNVLHGIVGEMDATTSDGNYIGKVSVKAICDALCMEPFTVRYFGPWLSTEDLQDEMAG